MNFLDKDVNEGLAVGISVPSQSILYSAEAVGRVRILFQDDPFCLLDRIFDNLRKMRSGIVHQDNRPDEDTEG